MSIRPHHFFPALFILCCVLPGVPALMALNVSEATSGDFPNTSDGPVHTLDAATNVFSGTLATPQDGQDRLQVVCPAGKIITQVTKSVSGNGFQGFVSFNNEAITGPGSGTFTGVGTTAYPLRADTYKVLASADFAPGATWTLTVLMEDAPDYDLQLAGGFLSITDGKGNSDTLTLTQPSPGTIRFAAAGRTFSLNNGPKTRGATADLPLSGVREISVLAMDGNDFISLGSFSNFPSLQIFGGRGDDTVEFTGMIALAPQEGCSVNLQSDNPPGADSVVVAAGAGVVASGGGDIRFKCSRQIRLGAGALVQTENDALMLEANQQTPASPGDFSGVLVDGATLRVTGTGALTVKGAPGAGSTGAQRGVELRANSLIAGREVSFTADSFSATAAVDITASQSVLLQPGDMAGVALDLGGEDVLRAPRALGLTDAELDCFTTPLLEVRSGAAVRQSAALSPAAIKTLRLRNDSAAVFRPVLPGVDVAMPAGGGVELALTLGVDITGLTPDVQIPRLTVAGAVHLAGPLVVTGSFAGQAGHTFTLVENDGADSITGAFTDRAAGSFLAWPPSPGLLTRLSLTGGSGNDAAIELVAPDAAFLLVTNANDSGDGSLRSAFSFAATTPGADTIRVAPALSGATITFSSDIVIPAGTGAVTIDVTALPEGVTLSGGGVTRLFENNGNLTLRGFTLANGRADDGGAIFNNTGAALTLHRCTVSGNTATDDGGGIYSHLSSTITLTQCTISGNVAADEGGAICLFGATASLNHVTATANTAPKGGAVFNSGEITANNSILAGNTTSLGGDVFGEAPLGLNYLTDTSPRLAPLAGNGGGTKTHALLSGSPARNAAGTGITTDQRGFPVLGTPDIGAYEDQPWLPLTGEAQQHLENFNTLGTASLNWSDHAVLTGWMAQMNNGATAAGQLQANNGGTLLNGLLNLGAIGSDRALGSKANAPQANISYAIVFRNVSDQAVRLSRLRYAMELWRTGTSSAQQERWTVFHSVSDLPPVSIASGAGSATASPGAGFTALPAAANAVVSNPAALNNTAVDGNAAANRSLIDFTFPVGTGPIILPDQYFTLKWTDPDLASATDGFQGLDDVTLNFTPASLGEIALAGAGVSSLVSGTNVVMPTVPTGGTSALDFTLLNLGTGPLSGITVSLTGPDAAEFALISPPPETLAVNASSVFTVQVRPAALAGVRTAALHIVSSDENENPFLLSLSAETVSLVVSTTGDSGPGSLRAALEAAAKAAGPDTLELSPALAGQTIGLTSLIEVSDSSAVTLDATGLPGGLTVTSLGSHGHFNIRRGILTMNGMTFTGGRSQFGGSIRVVAELHLSRCVFDGNIGGVGGAIVLGSDALGDSPVLKAADCVFKNGFATQAGAVNSALGITELVRCRFTGLGSQSFGSAICGTGSAILSLTDCLLDNNSSNDGRGALCWQGGVDGRLSVTRCTLAGNAVSGGGPAAFHNDGVAEFSHCTITGNGGAGLFASGLNTQLTLQHCLIAGNAAGDVNSSVPERLTSLGHNLVGNGTAISRFNHPGDIVSTEPLLAPLGDYGGPLPTIALRPGSPARDAAVLLPAPAAQTADARGFSIVGVPDIGAYEAGTLHSSYNAYIWETLPTAGNGLITDPLHAPGHDFDGDGQSNLTEWHFLTDAGSRASFFQPELSSSGSGFLLSFSSSIHRTYTLLQSDTLLPGSWLPVPGFTPQPGNGSLLTVPIPGNASRRFFQVQVTVP